MYLFSPLSPLRRASQVPQSAREEVEFIFHLLGEKPTLGPKGRTGSFIRQLVVWLLASR